MQHVVMGSLMLLSFAVAQMHFITMQAFDAGVARANALAQFKTLVG